MSTDSLYREMGLRGYGVEDTWEGKGARCLCWCRLHGNCWSVATASAVGCMCMSGVSVSGKRLRWE
jgi:hypothetical protein